MASYNCECGASVSLITDVNKIAICSVTEIHRIWDEDEVDEITYFEGAQCYSCGNLFVEFGDGKLVIYKANNKKMNCFKKGDF